MQGPSSSVSSRSEGVFVLKLDSQKLAPRFVKPFKVDKVVNSSVVCIKLPSSLKVHLTFHVSLLKPVSGSDLVPPSKVLPQVN